MSLITIKKTELRFDFEDLVEAIRQLDVDKKKMILETIARDLPEWKWEIKGVLQYFAEQNKDIPFEEVKQDVATTVAEVRRSI